MTVSLYAPEFTIVPYLLFSASQSPVLLQLKDHHNIAALQLSHSGLGLNR